MASKQRKHPPTMVVQGTATELIEKAVKALENAPAYHKELARVESVFLGREAHGIFTCWVSLDAGPWKPTFGGMGLDTYDSVLNKRVGHARGMDFIIRLFDLFGVDDLKDIIGKPVLVLLDRPGAGMVHGLEAPPWQDSRRFMLDDWLKYWGQR